jgi:hypothetical protein
MIFIENHKIRINGGAKKLISGAIDEGIKFKHTGIIKLNDIPHQCFIENESSNVVCTMTSKPVVKIYPDKIYRCVVLDYSNPSQFFSYSVIDRSNIN